MAAQGVQRKLSEQFGKIGLGCMGISGVYGKGLPDEQAIAFLKDTLTAGVRFFDTADVYGRTSGDNKAPGHNERILGAALQQSMIERKTVCIATKVGYKPGFAELDFSPEHIQNACELSLQNLFPNASEAYIDLYYLHRMPQQEQWDDTLEALSQLVIKNKIRYIGLSEPSVEFINYVYDYFTQKVSNNELKYNPLTAVETEFSIFSPGPLRKQGVIDTCAQLGLTFSPYGSLCHGLLTEKISAQSVFHAENGDLRGAPIFARFQAPNFEANLQLKDQLVPVAHEIGCSLEQLALAWSLAETQRRGCDCVLIPGTTKLSNLTLNQEAVNFVDPLSNDILSKINTIVPDSGAYGDRQPSGWRETHNVPKSPVNTLVFFETSNMPNNITKAPEKPLI